MKLEDIGEFKSVPQVIEDIINENTAALDDHLSQGWDIEQEVEIDESESLSPLDCALIMNCFKSVQWLVEHDVNLNVKENPGFLKAARYCDETVMKYIVQHGAKAMKGTIWDRMPLNRQYTESVTRIYLLFILLVILWINMVAMRFAMRFLIGITELSNFSSIMELMSTTIVPTWYIRLSRHLYVSQQDM